jgi:hypothetical protein
VHCVVALPFKATAEPLSLPANVTFTPAGMRLVVLLAGMMRHAQRADMAALNVNVST